MNATDADHLRRAIRLAMNGRGSVEPNPSVGCVLVKDDRVIGQGHTFNPLAARTPSRRRWPVAPNPPPARPRM